jgi:hypothetical protein
MPRGTRGRVAGLRIRRVRFSGQGLIPDNATCMYAFRFLLLAAAVAPPRPCGKRNVHMRSVMRPSATPGPSIDTITPSSVLQEVRSLR